MGVGAAHFFEVAFAFIRGREEGSHSSGGCGRSSALRDKVIDLLVGEWWVVCILWSRATRCMVPAALSEHGVPAAWCGHKMLRWQLWQVCMRRGPGRVWRGRWCSGIGRPCSRRRRPGLAEEGGAGGSRGVRASLQNTASLSNCCVD